MSNEEKVVDEIIKNVGGKNNISNAWHCMTRLRFDIKDDSLINEENIHKISKVIGSQTQNGQFQIIIGTDVEAYYNLIAEKLGISMNEEEIKGNKEKKSIGKMFMDTLSGVFGPIVPAIAGAGMIKGLIAGLVALEIVSDKSETIQVLDMLASGVFTFLPFFIAASAAKIFKTNSYLAVAIAAAMMFPTMTKSAESGDISAFHIFGFIPIPVFDYSGTVIPIIFSVLALSYVYRWVDKVLPKVLRTVFTPTFSLFIAGLIALVIIGPIGIYLGNGLAFLIDELFKISPLFAGVVVGAIRPIAVLTGLHHAMTPIALQNFANQGYDMLMPMMFMANMAIAGTTLAMYRKTKSSQEKSIIISSSISAFLGITEPALFGVITKYKRALIAATLGSAIASAFISFFGVRIYGYILSSIFSLPAYIGKYFIFAIIGIAIAIITAYVFGMLLVKKNDEDIEHTEGKQNISSITTGSYIPIGNIDDITFSSKSIGDGYAIKPIHNEIFSPVNGTIMTIFPTKHAIGIKTENGLEVLVHLGINTVELEGRPFEVLVKVGSKVDTKTQIASMDIELIEKLNRDTTILVIITNMDKVKSLPSFINKQYDSGEEMGHVIMS